MVSSHLLRRLSLPDGLQCPHQPLTERLVKRHFYRTIQVLELPALHGHSVRFLDEQAVGRKFQLFAIIWPRFRDVA